MSTTQLMLTGYYNNVMRVDAARIPAADQTRLSSLAAQVDAGTITFAAAQQSVASQAINTTSVANLAYNFFTGATPTSGGLDYLVSPTGANPNNLNSAYYQSFNLENRYINFSVNLGKLGEGATKFAAEYGALTLEQALIKAYTEIFGAPKAGIEGVLTADVGGQTRADYFAYYGRDGLTGIGTKAAMVGWLLAEAAKADTGAYAKAQSAFLADLGPDGLAAFNTNIVATYGDAPTGTAGATIAFTPLQSVSLSATDPALKATDNNDTLTGTGLDQGQSVVTGAGNDKLTITGAVGGVIDTGAGDDVVSIATLNPSVAILGGAETGTIRLGAGNDTLTITDKLSYGAIIDGGAGDDTLIAKFGQFDQTLPVIRNVEHLVVTGMGTQVAPLSLGEFGGGFQDVTVRYNGDFSMIGIPEHTAIKLENIATGGAVNGAYKFTMQSFQVRPPNGGSLVPVLPDYAELYLDNVNITGNFSTNNITVVGVDKGVRVHVLTDSVVGTLDVPKSLIISGAGKLTFGTGYSVGNIDATQAAAGVNITQFFANAGTKAVLSAANDVITVALDSSGSVGFADVTLGAGSDTVRLFQEVIPPSGAQVNHFQNMHITGQTIDGFARVLDFAKGVDHVDLGSFTTGVVTGLNVGTASTLEQALIAISPNVAAGATGVFEFGGDTYIYRQDNTVGANSGDGLIKLVGVTGLTVGTGAADVDIHYG